MGSFAAIQPPTPGTGLVWDTSELISGGKLKVAAAVANPPTIGSVHLSGSNIILEGSGGQPGSGFTVLTSTNVASPIVSWATAGSGTFDGSGNFSFTNAINLNVSQSYYLLRVP
jgi:hypothetical protein